MMVFLERFKIRIVVQVKEKIDLEAYSSVFK